MTVNNDDITRIMNLTKLMSLKITQLSPEPKIVSQLENLTHFNQHFDDIICQYKEEAEKILPLRQKISILEDELKNYHDSKTSKMIQRLQNEKLELEQSLEIASEDLIKANETINQLTIENQKANNKLQGEWKSTQDIRKTLQNERAIQEDLKTRINELKRTLRRLQRRLSRGGRLYGIHIPLEKIEDTEVASSSDNKEQIQQMKFELQKRMDKITELEMKNRELKNQVIKSPAKDLQLQIQNLTKELDAKEGKIGTFQAERTKLEQQIKGLETRITDLQVGYQDQSKFITDRDKRIKDLQQALEEARRKAEQGSMQLQGEVQELAIEEWLAANFPLDKIEEIKKGARGADCLQIVNTRSRKNCGKIYYESKRTKDFQPSWIEKFKKDIRDKGADIGVLVTQSMPSDMERMGSKDGIWVCTFEEFKSLCAVLRQSVIRISEAVEIQENKGDKMAMLTL